MCTRRTGRRRDTRRLGRATAAAVAVAALLSGCGIPVDPDDTLDRITGGELRVGASPSQGLVEQTSGDPRGALVDLITAFAETRDADITWHVDSEEDLVADLEAGELDLAIGGMTAQTPWSDRVSVTRGYPGVPGSDGAEVVVLLPMGENALQSALERFLDAEAGTR